MGVEHSLRRFTDTATIKEVIAWKSLETQGLSPLPILTFLAGTILENSLENLTFRKIHLWWAMPTLQILQILGILGID